MTLRFVWITPVSLALLQISGCQNSTKVEIIQEPVAKPQIAMRVDMVGYYVHDDPAFFRVKDMKEVAPKRIMHLGIEPGRWMMRNGNTAYGGTWVYTKDGATLTVTAGPNGQSTTAKRTPKGIELQASKDGPIMKLSYVGPKAPKDFGYDKFLGK